ncbi:MAG: hypothetical protein IJ455_06170 [Agathobacter sp.]|nr:hypothetical protein [Agathobacter sp.]
MDEIVNLIMGTSTTLDVYVIVRILVVYMSLEFCVAMAAAIGSTKK